jgi:cell division protein FtsQ
VTAPSRPQRRAPVVPAGPLLEQRARERRTERRRRLLHRFRTALVFLLPVATLAWVVLASSWLAVDRLDVRGVERLTAAQVVAAAAVEPGTPLGRVDTGAVADRIGTLAPVADVVVRRSWPGTLSVVVTEREPAAGVLVDGKVTLVDAGGVPFATEPELPEGVVRLQVHDPRPDDGATRAALDVHAALPEPLRSRVRIVRAASPSNVVLLLNDGRQVVWGRPGGTELKAAAAQALLTKPGSVYDVSAEDVAVVR